MSEPIINQKAPFVRETPAGTHWWCACGRSATQPFCDGSHRGTGLAPREVRLDESGRVAWCGCKRSKDAPFCDGTHRSLR